VLHEATSCSAHTSYCNYLVESLVSSCWWGILWFRDAQPAARGPDPAPEGVVSGPRTEHVLRKIHHCTFQSQKLDFWTTFFTKKFLFIQPNFWITCFLSLHKKPFITAHFESSHLNLWPINLLTSAILTSDLSFIHSRIYKGPLQEIYSEAPPTQPRRYRSVF